MAKSRVFIAESDSRLVQSVREQFLKYDFEVSASSDLKDLRFLRDVNHPHIVLLELELDGASGAQTIEEIRKVSKVPIIALSGRSDIALRVAAFEAGADDVVPKPFDTRELVARVQAVLRRAPVRESAPVDTADVKEWRFKGLWIQSNRRRVLLDGETVELTTAEFDLLRLLVSNFQNVLSREKILEELRGIEWEAVDRSIDILVSRLRDKLKDDPRRPRFIRTVRSVGYQFIGEQLDQPAVPEYLPT